MSGPIVKEGYVQKYSKGMLSSEWKKCYLTLYKDSSLFWFKNKSDPTSKGNVMLKTVSEYFAVGSYCRAIPYSPELPAGSTIDMMIAIPQEPNRHSKKINFFLFSDTENMNAWMTAITSTLPPPPGGTAPPPAAAQAPPGGPIRPQTTAPQYAAPPPYAPTAPGAPPVGGPGAPPPPGPGIGFDTFAGATPGGAPPYPQAPPQVGYPGAYPQAPYPQQTSYPGSGYPPPPPGPGYPPAAPPRGHPPAQVIT